jgi:hypothetical protein
MARACVPGSSTTPGRPSACVGALGHIAFRYTDSVGTRNQFSIAAQWLACTFPCLRFADILADACARLEADAVRYSFIVVDLHHLLLAGPPAHLCENSAARYDSPMIRREGAAGSATVWALRASAGGPRHCRKRATGRGGSPEPTTTAIKPPTQGRAQSSHGELPGACSGRI